ncbi:MAG: oligosaccharide flippase family protein [Parcubacteria group bacterium]|nr:oligosaccharide flippase family protein [Parcubacteria group bacterium]
MKKLQEDFFKFLHWSEKYTKTDMVYLFKGGSWLILAEVVSGLVSLAILVAFANWASKETFGAYQFVFSAVTVLGVVSLPGIDQALIRAVAKGNEGSLRVAFWTKLSWSTIGTIVLLVASFWYFINNNLTLALAFLVVVPFFQLRFSATIFQGFWEGKKYFNISLIYRTVTGIGLAVAMVVAILLTDKLWVLLLVFFTTSVFFNTLFYLLSLKRVQNDQVDDEMVGFGKHLTAMNLLEKISYDIDSVVLWGLFGPAQVVIYTLATKPIEKSKAFIPIERLALPILSQKGVDTEHKKKDIFKKFLMLFLLTIPAAIFLIMLAPFLYGIIFPKYLESVVYFRVLCVLIATLPFSVLISSLVAEMKTKYLYATRLAEPIIKILLLLTLAPIFGIWGVVVAILVSELLRDAIGTYFFWKM